MDTTKREMEIEKKMMQKPAEEHLRRASEGDEQGKDSDKEPRSPTSDGGTRGDKWRRGEFDKDKAPKKILSRRDEREDQPRMEEDRARVGRGGGRRGLSVVIC